VVVPVPLAALVTVIQLALLVAVQAHPLPVVSENELAPADEGIDCDVAESEYVHAVAPAWVTEKIWPAIVNVPERSAVVVFAATLNVTVPLSVPDAPLVIVIHATLLTAVHEHPVAIPTETLPFPAADEKLWAVGVIEGLHVSENANVFETLLALTPPGPTADTRAS
jgi:hypothetical protein